MYVTKKTPHKSVVWLNTIVKPILSFEHAETARKAHIVLDSGDFVLLRESEGTDGEYFQTPWWFEEAVFALGKYLDQNYGKEQKKNA